MLLIRGCTAGGSLAPSLHLPQSFCPSHTHTRTPKLCYNRCQGRSEESEINREKGSESVMDPDSWIKVKRIDGSKTTGARTQGYDILYHHCHGRQGHQRCLHHRKFYVTSKWQILCDIPRLLQIVGISLSLSLSQVSFWNEQGSGGSGCRQVVLECHTIDTKQSREGQEREAGKR